MEYLGEIVWLISWPVLIYIAYKFVSLNLDHHKNMEKLQEGNAN